MSQQLTPLSACVTRILALSGFSPALKTRDFQQAFADWENVLGGFKIKWINDTSLYIVFQDATVAKRAYLQALYSPPPVLSSPTSAQPPQIRPYDGPDAQSVIQAVNSRGGNHVRGHAARASIAVGGGLNGAHARHGSGAVGRGMGMMGFDPAQTIAVPPNLSLGREPSPTLPNLPSQPTLNSLISSSLSGDHIAEESEAAASATPPRIGEPGKRMVAHSLGVRHPGLSRSHSGGDLGAKIRELQAGMQGVALAE